MTDAIWIGPKAGNPPPDIHELRSLMEGVIRELNFTGSRAAGLRQRMRPWLSSKPVYFSPAPVELPPLEEVESATKNVAHQLGLDFDSLAERAGLND